MAISDRNIPLNERIIVALDVETPEQAKEIVKKCESHVGFYKVGLQLFMSSWFETVDWLVDRGHKVMLDLKFFDIPETVRLAVEQVNNRGVAYENLGQMEMAIEDYSKAIELEPEFYDALLNRAMLLSFQYPTKNLPSFQAYFPKPSILFETQSPMY